MLDFIVLGLPRSGTTWLANWLTTADSLCVHDPFAHRLPEQVAAMRDRARLGIACTGTYLMPALLAAHTGPIAVIERDPAACTASLRRAGLDPVLMPERLRDVRGRRWRFEDLWIEEKARELWAFLLPDVAFDATRYRLLRDMRIEPRHYDLNPSVLAELVARGLLSFEETP